MSEIGVYFLRIIFTCMAGQVQWEPISGTLACILFKIWRRTIRSSQSLSIWLLLGIITMHLSAFLFTAENAYEPFLCLIRIALPAMAHAICFGVVVVKYWNNWLLLFFIVTVQMAMFRELGKILNPTLPFGIEQREEANECKSDDEEKCSKLPNYRQSEELSLEGVNLAEKGNFENAMEKFDEAIKVCPENASPYNNRAQLFRLLSKIPEALHDLEKALELCGAKGRTAAQSFVQKALIHQFRGEEAMAKVDFEQAAKLGSKFAKNQLIAMNPYAAMCNKMLGEMMSKFRREEHYAGRTERYNLEEVNANKRKRQLIARRNTPMCLLHVIQNVYQKKLLLSLVLNRLTKNNHWDKYNVKEI